MSPTHTSLDAAATERKARLAKLASLKRKQPPSSDPDADTDTPTSTKTGIPSPPPDASTAHLSLRNYDPTTRGPKLGFEAPPVAPDQETLESRAAALSAETKAAEAKEEQNRAEGKGIDLFDLAPKKPNWDLKRDLARKMEVLEQRTDNAIARLVRERVEGQKKVVGVGDGGGEGGMGMEGEYLVEGVHVREREVKEEERRERELEREDEDGEGV